MTTTKCDRCWKNSSGANVITDDAPGLDGTYATMTICDSCALDCGLIDLGEYLTRLNAWLATL